ncbi:MAG: pantoate--beta-alanine ligase [Acidobacteria bacterium]|nr:pantoate--beta-alanine ligase [Acidobacteriota bacterium]MBI3280672.1 pantoate--beta-alanine ligase [Acidobacteriota bacterium]
MEVVHSIAAVREKLAPRRGSVGLVPTMGALHRGHLRLIEEARARDRTVTASIFVNPIQFNQPEDYARYPRTLEGDVAVCESAGVDLVFAPPVEEMYPVPPATSVEVATLTEHLCGARRPGHFRGVATVVMKLFEIFQPDRAYFGEKDAQQLAVIERMVRDLNVPVEIIRVPTVREADGLAISSRNQLLSAEERRIAPLLFAALEAAAGAVAAGERDAAAIKRTAAALVEREPRIRVEYLELVDAAGLQPLALLDRPGLLAAAIWLGTTRLIDNVRLEPRQKSHKVVS